MSDLQVFECEQGSPDWYACRAGIPTASEFHTVMASGKTKGSPSITRRKYMLTLIGQRLTGKVEESYTNANMERGKVMEAEARDLYAFRRNVEPQLVGFMKRCGAGASPDSLIGADGGLEIKTALPHIQIERLLTGTLPSEHVAQVQGQLWVSTRSWIDFVSHWTGLPQFEIRVHRDEATIARIAEAVSEFNDEMDELTKRVQSL